MALIVKIEVAVRDAQEQRFIDNCTVAVNKFVDEKNLDVQRICFARKSSYAGVTARDYHLYRSRSDHSKEIWINIKECSSDVNVVLRYMASSLYFWGRKENTIAKNISEIDYVRGLLGDLAEVAEIIKEVVPVARPQAAAPKVRKVADETVIGDLTIKCMKEHKLIERKFMDKLVAYYSAVAPTATNKFKTITIRKSKYSSEVRCGETSGYDENGNRSVWNSAYVSPKEFSDKEMAYMIMESIEMLGLGKVVNSTDLPPEEDITHAVLMGKNGKEFKMVHAMLHYLDRTIAGAV